MFGAAPWKDGRDIGRPGQRRDLHQISLVLCVQFSSHARDGNSGLGRNRPAAGVCQVRFVAGGDGPVHFEQPRPDDQMDPATIC
jgi:hypothetical protein